MRTMDSCPQQLKEILSTIYNLSDAEMDLFYLLCSQGEVKVSEIAEEQGRDRSTVQRYLKGLLKSSLVKRKSKVPSGSKKGRYYLYSLVSKVKLKQRMKRRLEDWMEEKKEVLNSLWVKALTDPTYPCLACLTSASCYRGACFYQKIYPSCSLPGGTVWLALSLLFCSCLSP